MVHLLELITRKGLFPSEHKRAEGFTLLELLIAITIIGILSTIATLSYGTAQKKARDMRRKDDMRLVQQAFEQYYLDNTSAYPATCTVSTTYLPGGMPTDPKTGIAYTATTGWSSCSATVYCLCAGLETETNATANCAGNPAPAGYTGLFCVRSVQ